jgi:hypothetical protein
MSKSYIVPGDLSMADLAATLTRQEQLKFQQLEDLKQSPENDGKNSATFKETAAQLGPLTIVDSGAASSGKKLFETKALILQKLTSIDVYRSPNT